MKNYLYSCRYISKYMYFKKMEPAPKANNRSAELSAMYLPSAGYYIINAPSLAFYNPYTGHRDGTLYWDIGGVERNNGPKMHKKRGSRLLII